MGKVVGTTSEIVVTSVPPSCGGPAEILDRRHWAIENRHVRDMTYDEDCRRNHVGSSARALARNAAISIVRLRGRFDYLAHRHSRLAVRELTTEVF